MNEVYFENIEDVIVKKMTGYTHVLVASAWLTSNRIIERLCEMDARAVISDKYEPHRSLKVPVKIVASDGTNMMHHKFMVLGDASGWKEVITGSYNFTENAKSNKENIIASKDAGMVAEFASEFEKLFPPPSVTRLSLNHVVITQQLGVLIQDQSQGEDLTETWEQHPIVSQLIETLFHHFGHFDIRDETNRDETNWTDWERWAARDIVCILNERRKDGSMREILVVKDDTNLITYTISNYGPPDHGCREGFYLNEQGCIKIIKVRAKDDHPTFVWTACGRGSANHRESICPLDAHWGEAEFEWMVDAYNDDGLWSEGMDVVTYLGRGYIMSVTELWAYDEDFWRGRRREYLNQDGQIDEELYVPEWVTFGWSLPNPLPCKELSCGWRCEFHHNRQGPWDSKITYGKGCALNPNHEPDVDDSHLDDLHEELERIKNATA